MATAQHPGPKTATPEPRDSKQDNCLGIGIDFGTTRTVVARADRGNYPVVLFNDDNGDPQEFMPSLTALTDQGLVHGFAAVRAARQGAPYLRSLKRVLSSPTVKPGTQVRIGGQSMAVSDLLVSYLRHVRRELESSPELGAAGLGSTGARVVVAVPAHAFGAQRLLTLDAFKQAGFHVTAMLNEPSAAGFEFTHQRSSAVTARRSRVLVYDLGGGTYDTSLVSVEGTDHRVLASRGLGDLGGDDFDLRLVELALDASGLTEDDLSPTEVDALLEQCRQAKESLSPQTRRVLLEVGGKDVVVSTADLYAACQPLLERSLKVMAPLVDLLDDGRPDLSEIAGVYLVGGASIFPPVARRLRERFGRRVHRSPYPGASTAIGLAIASDPDSSYRLTDQLSRGFGVFRESEAGTRTTFDPIFWEDSTLPGAQVAAPGAVVTREYRVAHNLGWFRLAECSGVDADGEPRGHLAPYPDILFPFEPGLRQVDDLTQVPVLRYEGLGPLVRERYEVDGAGVVQVSITDTTDGYTRSYVLGERTS